DEREFDFFILKATISELDIAWKYDNAKTGPLFAAGPEHIAIGAGTDTLTGEDVNYNGVAYTAALDDTKLPAGLNVTYTDEVQTNVLTTANGGPFYKTTATISAQSGYEIAAGLPTQFFLMWQIMPEEFDLGQLRWADDPEYAGGLQRVYIHLLDVPVGVIQQTTDSNLSPVYATYSTDGWLKVEPTTQSYAKNSAFDVGEYTAGYLVTCDDNHTFTGFTGTCGAGVDEIEYCSETTAEISHVWHITPLRIKSSTKNSDWSDPVSSHTDSDGDAYDVPNANVMSGTYAGALQVSYYATQEDAENGINEIDVENDINVIPGKIDTYYIRLEIKPNETGNYELYDTVYGKVVDYLVKPFDVGDERTGITVDYGKDKYIYNGEQQGPDPVPSRNVKILYEYFNGADDTSLGTTKPTDVGQYYVTVKFADESYNTDFRLDPGRFYFEIVPIELTTLDWADQGGNKAPIETVASDTKYKGG
ncbi:MAG: hypothetical protein K2N74_03220, partial [Clostridiales bacterium]|nr:hypothetical protein [Clostridiales bacterium]